MQLIVMQRQREDAGVEPAFTKAAQDDLGLLLDQQQLQPREALPHLRHHVWKQVGAESRKDAEADGARLGIGGAARGFLDLIDFAKDAPRALGDVASDRRQHHAAWCALDQSDLQLFLHLADLRRQRWLADEAGRGGPAEMPVLGQGDEVAEVAQVHAASASVSEAGSMLPSAAGEELRIRWSKALSAAVEPAPMAITICLYGTVVASPAANTPGTLVAPRSSMTISPRGDSSTVPFSHSVLGSRPICTNTPSRSSRCDSPVGRSLKCRPDSFLPSPNTSVVCALTMMSTL